MSHVVSLNQINQFLPKNKWELDTTIVAFTGEPVDHPKVADLEETARGIVLGKLRSMYDTTGWLVPTAPSQPVDTPSLVVSIVAMLVAGWAYDRQFSEETVEGGSYGQRKVREAYRLLDEIVSGVYVLDGDLLTDPVAGPTVYESEPQFTMDMRP